MLTEHTVTNLINLWFRGVAVTPPAGVWMGLSSTVPLRNATNWTEVVGGSYARQTVTLTAPTDDGDTYTTAELLFPAMPIVVVYAAALFDASTAGNMLDFARFSQPRTFTVAGASPLRVPAGLFHLRLH